MAIKTTGGPLKPDLGLNGSVLLLDEVFLPLFHVLVSVYSDSISAVESPL